jgi:hypothetical protein
LFLVTTEHGFSFQVDALKDQLGIRGRAFKYQVYEIGRLMCEAKCQFTVKMKNIAEELKK